MGDTQTPRVLNFQNIAAAQVLAIGNSQSVKIRAEDGAMIPNPARALCADVVRLIRDKALQIEELDTVIMQLRGGNAHFNAEAPRWPEIVKNLERNGFSSPTATDTAACDLVSVLHVDLDEPTAP